MDLPDFPAVAWKSGIHPLEVDASIRKIPTCQQTDHAPLCCQLTSELLRHVLYAIRDTVRRSACLLEARGLRREQLLHTRAHVADVREARCRGVCTVQLRERDLARRAEVTRYGRVCVVESTE